MSENTNQTDYPKPIITFVLLAYNQEQYIREAVESALAQTYSPLEIILSDDCSTDSTYKIIKEIAANYRGKHTIVLNQPLKNLGLISHVNQALKIASGEFIVMAAGDDISEKDRVQEIGTVWINSNKTVKAIFSNLEKINAKSISLGPMFTSKPVFAQSLNDFKAGIDCWVVGASFSFAKNVYSEYGDINPKILQEDGCLAFRALLQGGILYLDKKLVRYRHHGNNLSQTDDPKKRLFLQKKEWLLKKGWINDAKIHKITDHLLLNYLKKQYRNSCIRSVFFNLPILGYLYNYARIKTKFFLKQFGKLN